MVGYVIGIEKSKIEKMDILRAKYPFLEQIIAQQTYDLFDIEEAAIDESILADKCRNHGSEGPEAFDEQIYSISEGKVRELRTESVREELSSQGIAPDFLVKTRHLKYEILHLNGEHHHDVTLTVYKA